MSKEVHLHWWCSLSYLVQSAITLSDAGLALSFARRISATPSGLNLAIVPNRWYRFAQPLDNSYNASGVLWLQKRKPLRKRNSTLERAAMIRLLIDVGHFAAVAGGECLQERKIGVAGERDKARRTVAEGNVSPARMGAAECTDSWVLDSEG